MWELVVDKMFPRTGVFCTSKCELIKLVDIALFVCMNSKT